MAKQFYKDFQWIKFCKKCGVQFLPRRYSWQATLGLCWQHRRLWFKVRYQRERKYNQTPERKRIQYKSWKAWVARNLIRRRKIVIKSYNKHKDDLWNMRREYWARKKTSE